jgi:hypothetical protein
VAGNQAGSAELLAQARQAASAHQARTGRMITAAELASTLGRRKATAAALLRQLKAEASTVGLAAVAPKEAGR